MSSSLNSVQCNLCWKLCTLVIAIWTFPYAVCCRNPLVSRSRQSDGIRCIHFFNYQGRPWSIMNSETSTVMISHFMSTDCCQSVDMNWDIMRCVHERCLERQLKSVQRVDTRVDFNGGLGKFMNRTKHQVLSKSGIVLGGWWGKGGVLKTSNHVTIKLFSFLFSILSLFFLCRPITVTTIYLDIEPQTLYSYCDLNMTWYFFPPAFTWLKLVDSDDIKLVECEEGT